MIINRLMDENNLTETERHLAHYLLDKNNNLEDITSTELGKKSYTSQSAVTRLYKKLGMKTYREFISTLIIEKNEYLKIKDLENISPIHFFSTYDETKKTLLVLYEQIMIKTNLVLEKNTLIRVCNRLMNASSVDVYGIGLSDALARQLHIKLQMLGIYNGFQSSYNPYYFCNMKDLKNHVAIILDIGEPSDEILKIVKKLQDNKVYTVGIFNKNYQNKNITQDTLLFDIDDEKRLTYLSATFAIEYIINLIFSMLLYRYKK